MEAFYILLFIAAPLIPLPIAVWAHRGNWAAMRWPVYFSIAYVLVQAMAHYYVYYCFSRGYQDALISLIVPYGFAALALPVSWLVFIFSFPDKPRPGNEI